MERLVKAQRLWLLRRLLWVGGSAAATAALAVLHIVRLGQEPRAAAVYGAAILVTGLVSAILFYLTACHLAGPEVTQPAWKRHAHRASLREAPAAALAGLFVAAILATLAPQLTPDERPPDQPAIALAPRPEPPTELRGRVEVAPEESTSATPIQPAVSERDATSEAPPSGLEPPTILGGFTQPAPEDAPSESIPATAELVSLWYEDQEALERQQLFQEPEELPFRLGVPSELQPAELPPVMATVSFFVGTLRGQVNLEADGVGGLLDPYAADLSDLFDQETWRRGGELLVEFPLSRNDALKVSFFGMHMRRETELDGEDPFGRPPGEEVSFTFTWAHLFAGFTHKAIGYTSESRLDLALHVGAMVDHTLSRMRLVDSGQVLETGDDEQGWSAPAAGLTVALWSLTPGGWTLEVLQSLPVNIGGQTLQVTDVRLAMQVDISERVSFILGYRRIFATYRTFDHPVRPENSRRTADFEVGGPIFGIDIRI